MRIAAIAIAATLIPAVQSAHARAPDTEHFLSRAAVAAWIDDYRHHPEPSRLPEAVRALSTSGALREPEAAGFHVGFVAGVLGAHPEQAERLVHRMLPLPPADQWLVVRAIAYSGLPAWKSLLARIANRLPARRGMIDAYLSDRLPVLDAIELDKSPTFLETVKMQLGVKPKLPEISYGRNPELLDTLWGQYFATGAYKPVWHIIAMLPWSKERDNTERLTVGSMAKVTLSNNAARYPDLLALIKEKAGYQNDEIKPILRDVIRAAETIETASIRKEQLAAIERLKTRGAGAQRDMKLWGTVGQGAIGLTCVTLAALSFTTAGLPCVIGGAATSAALSYWAAQ